MSNNREADYEALAKRFAEDAEFRSSICLDATKVLEKILGELTAEERAKIENFPDVSGMTDEEIIELGKLHTMAW